MQDNCFNILLYNICGSFYYPSIYCTYDSFHQYYIPPSPAWKFVHITVFFRTSLSFATVPEDPTWTEPVTLCSPAWSKSDRRLTNLENSVSLGALRRRHIIDLDLVFTLQPKLFILFEIWVVYNHVFQTEWLNILWELLYNRVNTYPRNNNWGNIPPYNGQLGLK